MTMSEPGQSGRRGRFLEDFGRDVRHMARGFRRNPGFATAVILTLALGIGGNTAIFSVVDQLLLRPLPYPEGDELLVIRERFDQWQGSQPPATVLNVVSPANWLDWKRQNRTLEDVAAWRTQVVTLTGGGEPVRLNAQMVSAEFFPLLGVAPLLGRTLTEADDRPKAPRAVVLSYRLWQQRFGGDSRIVGRVIDLFGQPTQIVGVMPQSFRFVYQDNDLWAAIQLDRNQAWRQTSGRFVSTVARVKPRTTVAQARADLDAIAAQLAATYPFNKGTGVTVVPMREILTGQVQTSVLVLYGAVAVLLLIACFNVANLLLARASARIRELAIRSSLGAGRATIMRQLLVESVLLASAGGVLGIALARWSLDALVAFAPPDLLRVPELTVDVRVLVYALGVSVLTGLVVGLAPAALVARRSIAMALRSGSSTITHAPHLRHLLVVGQVAMTVILLSGAGLLIRTIVALDGAADGFNKTNVLTMEVTLPAARYDAERRTIFYRDAIETIRGIGAVDAAGAANSLAVIGTPRGGTGVHRLGTPERPMNESDTATIRVVTPGYFRTLGIPVLSGREFAAADDANPRAGFVVNEAFAKAYLSDVEPLGVQLRVWMQDENPYLPVIGVVGDVSEGSVREAPRPTVFYNHRLMPEASMTLVIRTGQPRAVAEAAVAAMRRVDPTVPVTKVRTFEEALGEAVARERVSALVSGALALSGLLLASLGLYGVLALIVAERTKEIAIRMALGAETRRVTRSVVAGGLRLVAVGAVIGMVGSLFLLPPLATMLFDVTPYVWMTYAVVLGVLAAVGAAASFIPARNAARVKPLDALRQE
jgi:putative ABC transport system permease protein